jgi:hypothetical protein
MARVKPRRSNASSRFTSAGDAAYAALPEKAGEFLKAYLSNRSDATRLALDASTISPFVFLFMKDRPKWSGTAAELLEELTEIAGEKAKEREFPKAANTLTGQLRKLASNFRASGLVPMVSVLVFGSSPLLSSAVSVVSMVSVFCTTW